MPLTVSAVGLLLHHINRTELIPIILMVTHIDCLAPKITTTITPNIVVLVTILPIKSTPIANLSNVFIVVVHIKLVIVKRLHLNRKKCCGTNIGHPKHKSNRLTKNLAIYNNPQPPLVILNIPVGHLLPKRASIFQVPDALPHTWKLILWR